MNKSGQRNRTPLFHNRYLVFLLFVGSELIMFSANTVQAQQRQPSDAEGCAACAGCGTVFIGIPIAFIALNIALLVLVARDARARGMDNAALWMILVLFTSVIGLIIYLFSRPQGNLIACAHCGNSRLEVSAICPTCKHS
jgi:hypothetical protein